MTPEKQDVGYSRVLNGRSELGSPVPGSWSLLSRMSFFSFTCRNASKMRSPDSIRRELRAIVRKTTSKVSVNVAAFFNNCHHIGLTG